MAESNIRDVDRLTAAAILAELGLDAQPHVVDRVAVHLARHRGAAQRWAAERARSTLVSLLESEATERFPFESEDWTRGFGHAEGRVARMQAHELLDEPQGTPQSQGQVLRAMLRQAKSRST